MSSLRSLQGLDIDRNERERTFGAVERSLRTAEDYWEMGQITDAMNSLEEMIFRANNVIEEWKRGETENEA